MRELENKIKPIFFQMWAWAVLVICILWVFIFKVPETSSIIWYSWLILIIATIMWIFMAMSIWANDVANNMWPAVWSKALTLAWAIIIAALFEAGWAIIAGSDVVDTIKWWIIDSSQIQDPAIIINIMLSTLIWAVIWVSFATFSKAPVSATHSILWALMWAWIVSAWSIDVVQWGKVFQIFLSWVISPVMWWVIAVLIFLSIRHTILKKHSIWQAAKVWVPVFVWIMAWVFTTYLILKWLKSLISKHESLSFITPSMSLFIWFIFWVIIYLTLRLHYNKKEKWFFQDSKDFVNRLFNIPLVFAVALLSFAHWANDVANAIWPLAAINEILMSWKASVDSVWIPLWIMVLWWLSIATWLMIFGSRLIKAVWSWITKLNQVRAYSVALSAAITVLIASHLWLPVSSTHIAIWWIFWIWFLREFIKHSHWKDKEYINKWSIKTILIAWVTTLPISAIVAWTSYYIISKI